MGKDGWRDKFVFNFNWRNFKRLEATWPDFPSDNFAVSMQRGSFGIEGMPEADTAKLNTFLDNVSLLTVDEYFSAPALIDSLRGSEPQMLLRIFDAGNRTYSLRVYDAGDSRRVAGLVQNSQGAFFERRKIQQIFQTNGY